MYLKLMFVIYLYLVYLINRLIIFFFQAEDGIRARNVTGVQTCALPIAIYGIDLCDVHVAIAPRPLLSTIENYSPEFNETAQHVEGRYRLLDVADRFSTVEATDPHAMTVKLRLAATGWFCRWFYNRSGPALEPEYQPEPDETLYCT